MTSKNLSKSEISPRLKQIVEFVFDNPGLTHRQLAAKLGLSHGRISQVLNHERVIAYYPVLAKRQYNGLIPKALRAQAELVDLKSNPMVRDKASARVLEAANILNSQPLVQVNVLSQLTEDELRRKIDQSTKLTPPSIDTELA